ncbi:hypothetical protein [Janibacter sp. DB-40]|uniref:hypothetical protein n=1 Tax=Janibacter sp. DB-40 TaxID=3028808 RepID=UPI002405D52C|nr:hypothetical protein [Janibacter sp. DB-40]
MRSLAEDIRHRTDEELVALLELRPDLARPQPSDLTALAARASTRASTARAIDHLDLPHLTALQACVVAGVDTAAVADLLGTDEARATALVDDLSRAALLWESATGRQVTGTVVEVLGPHPAGLGATAASLAHTLPDDVPAAIESVGAEAEHVLHRIAWHGPTAARPSDTTGRTGRAVESLVDAGLVVAVDEEHVTLPREVGLVVRRGRLLDSPSTTRGHRLRLVRSRTSTGRPPPPRPSWSPSSTSSSTASRRCAPGCCAAAASPCATCAPSPPRSTSTRRARHSCSSSCSAPDSSSTTGPWSRRGG